MRDNTLFQPCGVCTHLHGELHAVVESGGVLTLPVLNADAGAVVSYPRRWLAIFPTEPDGFPVRTALFRTHIARILGRLLIAHHPQRQGLRALADHRKLVGQRTKLALQFRAVSVLGWIDDKHDAHLRAPLRTGGQQRSGHTRQSLNARHADVTPARRRPQSGLLGDIGIDIKISSKKRRRSLPAHQHYGQAVLTAGQGSTLTQPQRTTNTDRASPRQHPRPRRQTQGGRDSKGLSDRAQGQHADHHQRQASRPQGQCAH